MIRALQSFRDGLLSMAYPQDCHLCSKAVESWDDGVVCSKCWHNPSLTKLFKGEDCCTKCNALMPAVRHFSAPPNQANQFAEIENSRAALLSKETFSDVNRLDEMAQTRWCRQCEAMPFAFARTCGAYSGTLAANILFLKSQPQAVSYTETAPSGEANTPEIFKKLGVTSEAVRKYQTIKEEQL